MSEHSKTFKRETKTKIETVKKEQKIWNMQEIQKKLIFAKQIYYEAGGKSLKLLAFKLWKQQAHRTIYKIHNKHTNRVETSLEKIHKCFRGFSPNLIFPAQITQCALLQANKTNNIRHNWSRTKWSVIRKLKVGKSPGMDGFTSVW